MLVLLDNNSSINQIMTVSLSILYSKNYFYREN